MPRRSRRCTVLVIGITTFTLANAADTRAQHPPESEWWLELQTPDDDLQKVLIQHVQATPASALDPALPAVPLDAWLWVTLAPLAQLPHPGMVVWEIGYGLDRRSVVPQPGPELCAEATVQLSPEKTLKIRIAVADAVRNKSTGRLQWRPTPPALREVYVDRMDGSSRIDSFDVPTLSAVSQSLKVPFDEWPTVDFENTIAWDPPHPAPGTTVRFSITVRNVGKRLAAPARIVVLIGTCCDDPEIRHEFFQRIPAGEAVRVEVAVPLPKGIATVAVSADPWVTYKSIRQKNRDQNTATAVVGVF